MTEIMTDLIKLRNTLKQMEVRGENVKIMSNCMFFLDQMVVDIQNGKYNPEDSTNPEDD